MKWRVERPNEDAGVVEAEYVEIHSDSLVFYGGLTSKITSTPVACVTRAYAPGQWSTVERVEGDDG